MIAALSIFLLLLGAGPAVLFAVNWRLYRVPEAGDSATVHRVSLLIPARNEAEAIEAAVRSGLASEGVELELIVIDDHSEDATAQIVERIAADDSRVRLEQAPPLPAGWCGKQHACYRLAELSTMPVLAFIDADVRLEPDALARVAGFLRNSGAGLVSGIPRQQTESFLEQLLIPLIHFVLLGFLPISRLRASSQPSYGAGCGQFFVADRDAYFRGGGHAAIRASMHDGIMLPRAFRRAGIMTDLIDVSQLASCRMYTTSIAVWNGLAKNATEAMASPAGIVPWTVMLLGGQVLPAVLLVFCLVTGRFDMLAGASAVALTASLFVRLAAARRFDQPILSAILHPVGIGCLVAIQWHALIRKAMGVAPVWRGRAVKRQDPGSAVAH